MIRSYDLTNQEEQDIVDKIDEELELELKYLGYQEEENKKLEEDPINYLIQQNLESGSFSSSFAPPTPIIDIDERNKQVQLDVEEAPGKIGSEIIRDHFRTARRNIKDGSTLSKDDPKLLAEVKRLRRQELEQNHMDSKIEDQMELLSDTEAQLKYGPGPVSSIIGGTLKSDVQEKLYEKD